MSRRPLIGVTGDIERHSHASPPRLHYELDAHLTRSLFDAGALVVMLPHDERMPDDLCALLDGLVLSGGTWLFPHPDIVGAASPDIDSHKHRRALFELQLARWAMRHDKPLLGICGGFQVLNAAAGGVLDTDLSASVSSRRRHAGPDRSKTVHTVLPVSGTRLAAVVGEAPFAVNSQHRQGVAVVGPEARDCAHADDGLVEAIECPDHRFCIGVQWHPEFVLSPQDRALLSSFVSASCSNPQPTP